MSVTVHAPHLPWAQAHRILLAVALLCVAFAATAGALVVRASGDAVPSSPSVTNIQPLDDGCLSARPAQPC
jgi:hypothetical protein